MNNFIDGSMAMVASTTRLAAKALYHNNDTGVGHQ